MKMKTEFARLPLLTLTLTLAMLGNAGFALAHHSVAAEFDQSKPVTFTGTVQKVAWLNPHIYTHVTVKADDGTTAVYRVEGGPPNSLYRQGWRKDSLKTGDVVTVKGVRAKNPESFNVGMAAITSADGRRIFSGTGPASEAAAAP
jgi:DNA/RNA endonuclease YhcR with UshA esterase domain